MDVNLINEQVLDRFSRLKAGGKLAHAYLFAGPQQSGKLETALAIAKMLNCAMPSEDGGMYYCGRCPPCLKISSGNHPDVQVVTRGEEEQSISIDQVRELIRRIQMRSFEAAYKVFLIREIECLTPEAGNALLKTLEEPSANSFLVLTTAVPEKNLSTIRSRCHTVTFAPWPTEKLAMLLRSSHSLDQETAGILASFAEGCPGRARKLHEGQFIRRKNEVIDRLIFAEDIEPFVKGLVSDRERTKEALDVLLSWFHDTVVFKTGGDQARIIHQDRKQEIAQQAARYSFEQLQSIIDEIVSTTRMWADNFNVKIAMNLVRERIWARS